MESWRTSIFPTRHPGDTRSLTAISLRKPASKERSWMRDRKSTRLNSSHGYISYAVFCLKKKKQSHDMNARIHVMIKPQNRSRRQNRLSTIHNNILKLLATLKDMRLTVSFTNVISTN